MQALLLALVLAQGPAVDAPPADLHGHAKPSRSGGPVKPLPVIYAKTITHPDVYLTHVRAFLKTQALEDRPFWRFLAFNQSPEPYLADDVKLWELTYNTLNPSADLARLYEVVGAQGRLYALDLRTTRWTVESFAAVARRDRFFREPHLDHFLAEEVRALVGIQQDPLTKHCDVMVPAAWLLREVFEPGNRTTALYDLLYSEERFGPSAFRVFQQTATRSETTPGALLTQKVTKTVTKKWPGGEYIDPKTNKLVPYTDPQTGKVYRAWPPNSFDTIETVTVDEPVAVTPAPTGKALVVVGQQAVNPKLLKDFPADLKEFQERWGITDAQKTFDKLRLHGKKGEVVVGGKNALQNGSIVAYNDRIIEIAILAGGFPSMRTRDFKKTAGRSNPISDLRAVVVGDVKEDAGEHLVTLPSGLQTAFLTGAAGDGRKRVEAGDAEVVHSSKDPSFGVVKTQFSCTICHGPGYGVLDPSNRKVTDTIARGIRLYTDDVGNRDGLNAFFRGWEEDTEVWRLPMKKALRQLTQGKDNLGWNGQTYADQTIRFRDWYDRPVGLAQAAAELGVPKLAVMLACMLVPDAPDDSRADAQNLFLDVPVPRAEWDEVLFPKLALIIALSREQESPNPLYRLLLPDLLRHTAIKGVKP